MRTLHYYVDSTTDAAQRVRGRVTAWPECRAGVEEAYDPGLRGVRHLNP